MSESLDGLSTAANRREREKEREGGEGGRRRRGKMGKDREDKEGQGGWGRLGRRGRAGKERVVALPQESTSWAWSSVPSLDSRWFCSSPPLPPSLKPVEIFSTRENRSCLFITAF